MKKVRFMAIMLIAAIFSGVMPTFAAGLSEVLITVDSGQFTTTGAFGGSSLKGYNGSSSMYDANADNAEAIFKPMLLNGGKYKIEIYNLAHTTNTTKAAADIYIENALANTVEFDHRNTESGMIDLGEYQLSPGDGAYVVMRKVNGDGFIRPNAVKFTLTEKDENAESIVEINEKPYGEYVKRTLGEKQVELPQISENKIYVCSGAQSGDGTEAAPFATIAEAQAKLKELIQNGGLTNGAAVVIRGGIYSLDDTLTIENMGGAPITYMAYEGEDVTLTAGKNIPSDYFEKVTDKNILDKIPSEAKDYIYSADLSKVGLQNIPNMNLRKSTPYTLVMGEAKGTLARWPNEGYGETGEVIDTGARGDSGPRKKGFTYEISDARLLRWKDAKNGWLNGYWMTPYTIDYASIAKIDVDKMRIVGKDWNGLGNYGYARYFAENLLEEIDKEGEWYLDTETNKLYIYPYGKKPENDVKFAASNYPVIKFVGATNAVVRGINIEVGGNDGVAFDENTSDCMIIGGEIKYVSGNGAVINGKNNTVRDCDISYVGSRGILVNGGNDKTLDPGGNVAENNEIHNTGTGGGSKQGITVSGCANRVSNNHVYDIPTHGIIGSGMEQIIENNIIERTNLEMGDTGGLYFLNYGLGYGTKIRYNIVKDSVGLMPIAGFSGEGALGIYIDDVTSGLEIYGNVVYNAKEPGTFIHGGRYNKIYNNMYINCDIPIRITKTGIAKSIAVGGTIWTNLVEKDVENGPIGQKYPQAKETFTDNFGDPINNTVTNNISFNGGNSEFENALDTYEGGNYSGNVRFDGLPDCNMTDFYDLDYTKIKEQCPGFEEIPFKEIGTYKGGARTDTESIVFDNRADDFSATYPVNGAKDVNPDVTLKWEKGRGGIRSYDVYVASDPEFKDIIAFAGTTDGETTMNLEYGKTYYWRVSASPMLNYDKRWNSNGVMSFTTVGAEDMLYGEYLSARALMNISDEGEAGGQYEKGAKEALSAVTSETLEAINSKDSEKMSEMKDKILAAKSEFISKRNSKKDNLQVLIYDDFENDTIGERPAGLFFRSYSPLNVKVAKDPTNAMNKAFLVRDEETTHQYGNRFFDPQDGYVELCTSVMAAQTTGSASIGLYKTGYYTTQQGTTGSCAARIVFASDSYIYDGTAKKTRLMKYSADQWYDIKVELNLKEKYYDIYINGELVKEKAELDSADVTSVNQFIFDTTEGTSSTSANRGGFYMDNIIVRAPKNEGANPYLMSLSVNGEDVGGFEPEKNVYDISLSKDDLKNAEISYTCGKGANVNLWKGENGVYITIVSGERKSTYTYYLRPMK